MPDTQQEIEEMKTRLLVLKGKAFECRVLLDTLVVQAQQMTDAWNKMCADIAAQTRDINETEKRLAVLADAAKSAAAEA